MAPTTKPGVSKITVVILNLLSASVLYRITALDWTGKPVTAITLFDPTGAPGAGVTDNHDGTFLVARPAPGPDSLYVVMATAAGVSTTGQLVVPAQGAGLLLQNDGTLLGIFGTIDFIGGGATDAGSGVAHYTPPGGGGGGGVLQVTVTLSNADILTLSSVGKPCGISVTGKYPVLVAASLVVSGSADGTYTGIDSAAMLAFAGSNGIPVSTAICETNIATTFPASNLKGAISQVLSGDCMGLFAGQVGGVVVPPANYQVGGISMENVTGAAIGIATGIPTGGTDLTLQILNPPAGSADIAGGSSGVTAKLIVDYILHDI